MFGDARERSALREEMERDFLTDRATIQRAWETPGDGGGYETDAVTVQTDVPCRARPASQPREGVEGERLVGMADWEIRFAVGTAIDERDRVLVDGVGTFDVSGPTDAGRSDATLLMVRATRV